MINMVYITESNLKSISKACPADSYDLNYIEKLYKSEICTLLCKQEKNVLAAIKVAVESYKDYDDFIKIVKFNKKPKPLENLDVSTRLIYLKNAPAYHKNKDCIYLNSSYINYEIPIEIPTKNIVEYRKFFLKNIYLYENNRSAFYAQVGTTFNVIIKNINEYHATNSGVEQILDFDLEPENILLTQIYTLGCEMIQYRSSNEKIKKTIRKYGSACHLVTRKRHEYNVSDDEYKIVNVWYNYKLKIKNLIGKHLIIKLNPDLKFDKRCLEYFNFKPCAECLHTVVDNVSPLEVK
ncbi:hypothetical protein [Aeromonas salmonicida]|uniref:hypothetical protein n=1 Tax=Aeromonas salmonicida TaxID=645 RepID=UPI000F7A13F0|nr:hypothetical protein [Aeromonas salmonicida]